MAKIVIRKGYKDIFTDPCDNKSRCHNPITIGEDNNALRVYCKDCHAIIVIRKDYRGVPERRKYAEVFKRDILQGNDKLFYKYYEKHIRH